MNITKHLRLEDPYVIGYDINFFIRECHDHDFYEFMLILNGNSMHCVNDGVQILKAGDLVCIRPDDAHFISPYGNSSEKYEFFNIHISRKHMETQFSYSDELRTVINDSKLPPVVNLPTNDLTYISKKLKQMNSMLFGDTRTFLYYSILKDMLWHMLAVGVPGAAKQMPEWFEDYLMKISKSDVFILDYKEIAAMANVSESYLWKLFKKYINMTPTEYINSLRLEYAYECIISGKYALGDVATRVGFNSYSYFYRKFMDKYGISPKKLREK